MGALSLLCQTPIFAESCQSRGSCLWFTRLRELALRCVRSGLCRQDSVSYVRKQHREFNTFFNLATVSHGNKGVPVLHIPVNMRLLQVRPTFELKESEENLMVIFSISLFFFTHYFRFKTFSGGSEFS